MAEEAHGTTAIRRGWLESGVLIASQGSPSVEQALARVSGEEGENKGAAEKRNSGMTERRKNRVRPFVFWPGVEI